VTDPSAASAPEIDPDEYRRVLGHLPTGVTVVTAVVDGEPIGMAVGSFFSVSLDPPLVGWCPAVTSGTWQKMRDGDAFCVNVLAADQQDTCMAFATRKEDKYEGIDWEPAATGSPALAGSLAVIDCTFDAVHRAGDHDIVVGRVQELRAIDGEPLIFNQGDYGTFAGS
jgi:flavin reductase (DIM6/NTAB) family NADH-FMN oxidoreductase RutF